MLLDRESCNRAVESADARFDGVFFVGITTTTIYCRPICPARRTLRKNRRYFNSAAAAERAGFRPCLRCRPELAPGRARVDAVPRLAEAAARRIAAGALNGRGLEGLAGDLGVSGRQLRRAMQQELGVSPIELAQTHRLLLAKQLLTETYLPMSRVADASGFQSVRRFNALFRERYRLNPESLRRRTTGNGASRRAAELREPNLRLALAYRPPLAWNALLAFLAGRANPGVERISSGTWSRLVRIDGYTGVIRVGLPDPDSALANHDVVVLEADATLAPALMPLCARVKLLFDLVAEPNAIESHLVKAGFGRIQKSARGLRVPGAWDGFELACRAILGQQVSVAGASTLMSRLTSLFGEPVTANEEGFTHLPPTAERLADAGVTAIRRIGLPTSRAETLHELATLVARRELSFEPDADVRSLMRRLVELRGIGPWTAEYIGMRALHWPDAFPASDLVLRRAAGGLTTTQLTRRAERWRPWRSYAAMHLWYRS
jgi:AraC family transcriptional regulator, regulatory protein of adaptative response / DNA-3-methyladenine glycosylase II